MRRFIIAFLKTSIPLTIGILLIWYFFSSMSSKSLEVFYQAISEANYAWIFISITLSFFAYVIRAYRWKYLLNPLGYQPSFWNRYHAIAIGYLLNYTIPRAGEVVRATMLYRSDGIPFAKSAGTIIVERAFDVLILLGLIFFSSILYATDFSNIYEMIRLKLGGNSTQSSSNLSTYIFIGVAALILILLIYKPLRKRIKQFILGVIEGVLAVFKTKHIFQFLTQTILIWVLFIGCFGICYWCFPETSTIPIQGILLGFLAGTVGISLTNGGIGIFPLIVGLSIEYYLRDTLGDKAQGIGFALGMIIWCAQTIMVIVLGVISLILLPKNYKTDVKTS